MQDDGRRRLTLVASDGEATNGEARGILDSKAGVSRHLDWTILMARAQDGDNVAYLRLLQEITPYLRSLVRRWHKDHWDIEDTVQDILLTLHSIRHTYDPSRPFGPWLVGIANRRAIDRLRRRGRQALREAPLTAEHEATAATGDNRDDILEKHHLTAALGGLPPVQRTAVDLLKLKEMSLKEASEATGLSIASLKMATHRALLNLRALLSDRRDS
ncbi:sigma-70 family RNA polymerase sigma factor (plasmid) [Rhizobium leguminosarum]|uniref:sigma-70 family RNA polymerase sigma factor n=1 Tax=Rhizobium leguminosarum TaxID=384 RepID=UPI0015FAC382|nr:sigma-70 family RNA polymerase sigma factor [Rhizobium leguminosarum]MBA9034358.1 RNA polymerase sigma-70 factor (ECF subfamily) [Rhizobium leguminosarum]